MKGFLRGVARVTGILAIYRRLVGDWHERVNQELAALRDELREHIDGINARQGSVNTDVIARLVSVAEQVDGVNVRLDLVTARLDQLDRQLEFLGGRFDELGSDVRVVVAARWDHKAISRRIAALEDRLLDGGEAVPAESAAPEPAVG